MELTSQIQLTSLTFPRESNSNTENSYFFHVKQFNTWNRGETINANRIQLYLNRLKNKGARPATIRAAKSALKKAVRFSLPSESQNIAFLSLLDTSFKEMKVDKTKYVLQDSSVLSRKEIQSLCKQTPRKLSLMIKALYNSGFRVSEFTKIRIKDCKITGENLSITIIRKRGKEVTISDAFPIKLFLEILEVFHEGKSTIANVYLFKNSRSGKGYYSRQYLWQEINKHSKRILGKPFSIHGLRHSHASSLLLAGAMIPSIAERLSHEDPGTTAKYYLHSKLSVKTLNKVFVT